MRLLACLLLLVSASADAATWYQGSAGSCTFNGDGTASTCAASGGAAGRWRSFSGIVWASVAEGDTICMVGDNTDAGRLNIQASSRTITITGDCAGQTTRPKLTTSAAGSVVIDGTDDSNVTLDFLEIIDGPATETQAIKFLATGANQSNIEVKRLKVSNGTSTAATPLHCIWFTTANGKTFSLVKVHDNEVYNCGISSSQNSDGINIEGVSSSLAVYNNFAHSNYNEGIDISAGGASPVVYGNRTHDNGFSGIKIHCGTGAVSGTPLFYGNVALRNGSWGFIINDWPNTVMVKNTAKMDANALGIGAQTGRFGAAAFDNPNTGTCTRSGNVISDNIFEADYANGVVRIYVDDKATFEAGNTINGNVYNQTGSQTPLLYFSVDTGNNVTIAGFSSWATGAHASDKNVAPQWIGNNAYLSGGRLLKTSTLADDAIYSGTFSDALGHAFRQSIGGIEILNQDIADTRTAATTRTEASNRTTATARTAR